MSAAKRGESEIILSGRVRRKELGSWLWRQMQVIRRQIKIWRTV